MRVLHYTEGKSQLERSGIGTSVDHQLKALREHSAVDVVQDPAAAGLTPSRIAQSDVPPALDAIHLNVVGPRSLAIANRYSDTELPVVLHAHTTAEDFQDSFRFSNALQPAVRRYLTHFYRQGDVIICPSQYTKDTLETYNPDAPITVVTNGVDIDSVKGYETLRDEYRSRYDLEKPVVFTLGNVFERKGLSTFIELAKRLPSHEFVWFGPYDTGPQASSAVRKHTQNPPENVTFTGWIEDKRGAFAAGDIYCFPTKEENQGIAALEAMACEKPAILSDIPVFQELYNDGNDCIQCSSLDEYEQAITRVTNDEQLAAELGRNGRHVAEQHALPRVANGLTEVYSRF